MNDEVRKVYVCGVDWNWEVGETDVVTYESVEKLKRKRTCWKQCGIVELEVRLSKVVEPGKPFTGGKDETDSDNKE